MRTMQHGPSPRTLGELELGRDARDRFELGGVRIEDDGDEWVAVDVETGEICKRSASHREVYEWAEERGRSRGLDLTDAHLW